MQASPIWMVLNEFYPKLLGSNFMETALSLDPSIKPNDLLYPKRLTLYDRSVYRDTLL
jgi:serine/threonine protein phosphatase 1